MCALSIDSVRWSSIMSAAVALGHMTQRGISHHFANIQPKEGWRILSSPLIGWLGNYLLMWREDLTGQHAGHLNRAYEIVNSKMTYLRSKCGLVRRESRTDRYHLCGEKCVPVDNHMLSVWSLLILCSSTKISSERQNRSQVCVSALHCASFIICAPLFHPIIAAS